MATQTGTHIARHRERKINRERQRAIRIGEGREVGHVAEGLNRNAPGSALAAGE